MSRLIVGTLFKLAGESGIGEGLNPAFGLICIFKALFLNMRFRFLKLLCVCCIAVPASSCSTKKPTKAYMAANPPKPVVVDGVSVIPKFSTEFGALLKHGHDTLGISVNSTYVYFPFGLIKSKSKPDLGILRNFLITNKIIKTDIGNIDIQILKHASSKLIFYFNTVDGAKYCDLVKGEVYDTDVKFINGIKIGMSTGDFYNSFFTDFPPELENKYHVFVLESVDGVKHIYSFGNSKLKSVKFLSNRAFEADY
jgi:hypothetical protein